MSRVTNREPRSGLRGCAGAALALALAGCGSPAKPEVASRRAESPIPTAQFQCAFDDEAAPRTLDASIRDSLPWITRGPAGNRLVAQAHRFTGGFEAFGLYLDDPAAPIVRDLGVGTPGSLAWTGATHLVIARDRILRFDEAVSREVGPRYSLPPASCGATLAEGSGRALAVWGRAQGERGCFETIPWFQAFDERGAPLGAAAPLPLPVEGLRPLVRWVRARWDFGRFVVTAEYPDVGVWSWVLDRDGTVLGSRKDHVACLRAGCVTVAASSEMASDEVDSTAQALRVQFLSADGGGFTTSSSAREVRGLVVSGDRLLVLHDTPDRASCGLAVLDVARRSTVTQLTSALMTCGEAHARPRPGGFVIAERDPQRGPLTRTIRCTD
ncbi:MAG: hypothetical protein R3A48_14840 [Polyangiales bacterium]